MKQRFTLILISFFLLCSASAYSQQIPNVSVKTQNEKTIRTGSLVDGKTPFIISFWSTICKPCIKELDAIYDNMEDWQEEADFRVIVVSTDDSRSVSRAKSMASSRGWTEYYTMLYDENQDFKRALNVNLTPQVFIFDKNGKQVYSHTGYVPGAEGEYIEKIISLEK